MRAGRGAYRTTAMSPSGVRECPHCGAALKPRARFCRECGSDASTGWSESADTAGHAPSHAFDDDEYAEFLARELPGATSPGQRLARAWPRLVGLFLAILLALWALLRF